MRSDSNWLEKQIELELDAASALSVSDGVRTDFPTEKKAAVSRVAMRLQLTEEKAKDLMIAAEPELWKTFNGRHATPNIPQPGKIPAVARGEAAALLRLGLEWNIAWVMYMVDVTGGGIERVKRNTLVREAIAKLTALNRQQGFKRAVPFGIRNFNLNDAGNFDFELV